MKNIKILVVIFFAVLTFTGCKERLYQPDPETYPDLFPLVKGSSFVYNVDSLDAAGNPLAIGKAHVSLRDTASFLNTVYTTMSDSLVLTSETIVNRTYIRKTNAGIYYFIDTTGLGALIPDTLKRFTTVDGEISALSAPPITGRNWNAYKFIAGIFSVISLTAEYGNEETLFMNLNGTGRDIRTRKVNYTLRITIPPQQQGGTPVQFTFNGSGWFSENIGLVKLEGDSVLFGFIGGDITNLFTNQYKVRRTLREYSF